MQKTQREERRETLHLARSVQEPVCENSSIFALLSVKILSVRKDFYGPRENTKIAEKQEVVFAFLEFFCGSSVWLRLRRAVIYAFFYGSSAFSRVISSVSLPCLGVGS